MPHLEYCLQRFPNMKILGIMAFWSEMGVLETSPTGELIPYPIREEGVVPKLFRRYSNLWGLSPAVAIMRLRDPDYAVRFLNEFQDRLCFERICARQTVPYRWCPSCST